MPTRQIGWNVSEVAFAVMYVLVALQAVVLAYGGTRRYLMWRRGRPPGPIGRIGERVRKALAVAFLHRRLIRPGYIYSGLMHLFIFWGFVVLFIGTLIWLLEADIVRPYFGLSFFNGPFYVVYKLVINLFGLLFLIGLLMAVYRRYGQQLPRFRRNLSDDAIVLGTLLFYIPVSKLAHIFTGPANVFLRATDRKAALTTIVNIEEQEHFGVAKLEDFSWKQPVNFDACMRCGRCLDFCPTFNPDKPLKPRQLIVEIGAYMNRQAGLLAGPAGPLAAEAGVRGSELTAPEQPSLVQ